MKITNDIVAHIAHLARLEFEGVESESVRMDLENIVAFMDRLNAVDTSGVEPLVFMLDEVNRLREDNASSTINREEALKNAPKKDSDYFRIPKVLEK
jgi:aspartyl-tRNA(Asn)/glutamyl-tRNA(Gln) amidotransferase subunit C